MILKTEFQKTLGHMTLAANITGLVMFDFTNRKMISPIVERIQHHVKMDIAEGKNAIVESAIVHHFLCF